MSSNAIRSIKSLGVFQKPTIFDKAPGALLPEAYKKFYKEWRLTEPSAVHYVPQQGKWKRDEVTGEVHPVQNIPLPLFYPKEHNTHMWGGEGVVQGFQSRGKNKRRVPHFWVPTLKRSVVHSEVLDKYFSVIVTERTIRLINANYGFDHYLLKTPACDLKSLLPLGLKRKILQELEAGCPSVKEEKRQEILQKYGKYLDAYSSEEIDWYGYSFTEACRRIEQQMEEEEQKNVKPLKHVYRAQLIDKLRAANIEDAMDQSLNESGLGSSWLQKINPFAKKSNP